MDNREDIIDKIRKLLALSKSPYQHEAELAMAKVNEIMTKYQIQMSEVDVSQVSAQEAVLGEDINVSETYRSFVREIAAAAGELFDTRVVRTGSQSGFAYVGLREDIRLSQIMFEYLWGSWLSIVSEDTKAWKRSVEVMGKVRQYEVKQYKIGHGQGFSMIVLERARALASQRKAQVKATGTSLIVLKDQIVKDWLDKNTIQTKSPGYKHQDDGFYEGRQRGREIPLDGALSNMKPIAKGD